MKALIVVDLQNGYCRPEDSLPCPGMALSGGQEAATPGSVARVVRT